MNQPTPLVPVNRPGGIVRLADAVRLGACLALLLVLAAAPDARAQANANPPGKLTYQGFLTDVNGTPLGNAQPINTNIIFRIHTASSGGTLRWAEQQTVTIDKGHFSVLLGEGAPNASEPFTNNLSGIFGGSDASERYMEITVGSTIIAPRMQFLPAPYAMLSASARQLVDATGNPVISSTGLNISGAATATSFSGNGAGLTSLNANNVSAGTLADGRLSANVALRNAANTFTSEQTINGILSFPNGHTIQAKNSAGTYETFIHPRWSDNATYMNFGSSGFHLRNNSATTRMFVNDTGRVGIGTTSPEGRLTVVGSGGVSQGVQIDNREIKFRGDGDTHWSVFANRLAGKLTIENTSSGNASGTAGTPLMTVQNNGRVGIGTTAPMAPLEVKGIGENTISGAYFNAQFTGGGSLGVLGSGNQYVSIKSEWYVLGYGFVAMSDHRIKNVVGQADGARDLATIGQLKVTDYRMKDTAVAGDKLHKGFIAQEVKAIIPEAVSKSRDFVPDIYAVAESLKYDKAAQTLLVGLVKSHELKTGDKVRLITDDAATEHTVIEVPDAKTFAVDAFKAEPKRLFVYGKQVDDFLSVDYNRIFTTGIAAIQQLKKEKDSEVRSLTEQNEILQRRIFELEAKVKANDGRLATLEKLVRGLSAAKAPANKLTGEE